MDMSSLALQAASFFGDKVLKKALDTMIGGAKRKRIDSLLREYKSRSFGVPTSTVCLPDRLAGSCLVEEFLAHCYRPTKPKNEIISLFLYGSNRPEAHDDAAEKFVGELFDEVILILKDGNGSAVRAAIEIQEHEDLEQKRHEEVMQAIREQSADMPDYLSTTLLIEGIESGQKTLEDLKNAVDSSSGKKKSKAYLEYYVAYCQGGEPVVDAGVIGDLPSSLVSSLASVAFSSDKHYAASEILSFASDADDYAFAARQVSRGSSSLGRISEEGVPANSPYAPFAMILNAEMCVSAGAYPMAVQYFELCANALNPVARVHQMLARLSKAILYCPGTVDLEYLSLLVGSFPLWASEGEKGKFGKMLDFALSSLSVDDQKILIESMTGEIRGYLPDAPSRIRLAGCCDAAEMKEICEDAAKRGRVELFCQTAEKLTPIDPSSRQWVQQLMETSSLLKDGGIISFLFLVRRVIKDIKLGEFRALGEGLVDNPRFHLEFYTQFKDEFIDEAKEHIEKALTLMKGSDFLPCPDYAFEWIPYLSDGGRSSEVMDILTPYMELMPESALRRYVASAGKIENKNDLASKILLGVEKSGNSDPDIKCLIAGYYSVVAENRLKASRLAIDSFHSRETDSAAAIAMESLLLLSMDIPSELVDYAGRAENPHLSILLAEHYWRRGQQPQADRVLVRAALSNESSAERVLAAYFSHHARDNEDAAPESVGVGMCVTLSSGDDALSLIIHEDAAVVPREGCAAFGALHYTSSSPAYYSLRGLRIGDHAQYDGNEWAVEKIEHESAVLQRVGLGYIAADSRAVVFTSGSGGVEGAVDQIADYLKEHQPKQDYCKEGIEYEEGKRLYLGIESGSFVSNTGPLEFIITVISNKAIPFRRVGVGLSSPVDEKRRFLLSYNSVVLLSLLCQEHEEARDVLERCCVTSSTKNRIEQDIHALSNATEGPGKLVLVDDRPMLLEHGEDERRRMRATCAQLASFVASLQVVSAKITDELPADVGFLDQNTIADMETAKAGDMFFVAEDCFQATFADNIPSAPERCSLYALAIACGKSGLALNGLPACMMDWGAEPHIDLNVAESIRRVIAGLIGFELSPFEDGDE